MCPDTIRPGIRIKYRLESMLKKYKSNRDKNKHSSGIVQEVHDEQYEELLLQKEEGQLLEEHKDIAGIQVRNAVCQSLFFFYMSCTAIQSFNFFLLYGRYFI